MLVEKLKQYLKISFYIVAYAIWGTLVIALGYNFYLGSNIELSDYQLRLPKFGWGYNKANITLDIAIENTTNNRQINFAKLKIFVSDCVESFQENKRFDSIGKYKQVMRPPYVLYRSDFDWEEINEKGEAISTQPIIPCEMPDPLIGQKTNLKRGYSCKIIAEKVFDIPEIPPQQIRFIEIESPELNKQLEFMSGGMCWGYQFVDSDVTYTLPQPFATFKRLKEAARKIF